MDTIKDLVKIITKYKTRNIDIIGYTDSKTQLNEFYNCVSQGLVTTDEEAAQYFYGDQAHKKSKHYSQLKFQLKKRLINTLFFIDVRQSHFNDYQQAYYTLYKEWAAIKILLGRAGTYAAIKLSIKVLKQSIKYDFTPLILDICQILRGHYATINYNAKKYEKYNNLYNEYSEIYGYEQIAEGYYYELVAMYNGKIENKYIFASAEQHLKNLPKYKKYKTYRLYFLKYMIEIIKYTSINDYKSCKKICANAIKFMVSKKFLASEQLIIFIHQKLVCHIQLKEYKQGQAVALKGMEMIGNHSVNWFKSINLYTLLALHSKEHKTAADLYQQALGSEHFKILYGPALEIWKLYEAYLNYLGVLGDGEKFKVAKFINEVPQFSKDKKGMNLPVIIVKLLFIIKYREYDKSLDQIGAIEKYFHRYKLTSGVHSRSYAFIKLLLLIPKNGYKMDIIDKKSIKYLSILNQTPLEMASTKYNIEIIPYEDLWKIVLGFLKEK